MMKNSDWAGRESPTVTERIDPAVAWPMPPAVTLAKG